MHKKLLITGFEPFGNNSINPSWEVVKDLPDVIDNIEITKLSLPVVFNEAGKKIIDTANKINPDYIIMVGLAESRKLISLERIAKNVRKGTDNNHINYQNESIDETGSIQLETNIDIDHIYDLMKDDYPVEISMDAGSYVCNDTFYLISNHYQNKLKYDFIHVPSFNTLSKEEITKTIIKIIKLMFQ